MNRSGQPLFTPAVVAALLVAALAAVAASGQEDPKRTAGFVVDIEGIWLLEIDGVESRVAGGQRLPDGGRLRPLSHEALIRIAFPNGKSATYKRPGNYSAPIVLRSPTVSSPASLPDRLEAALAKFYSRPRSAYVPNISRGGLARPVLREAVVEWTEEGLDLRPVFQQVPAGTYLLLLQKRVADKEDLCWTDVARETWRWAPGSSSRLRLREGFGPGLWRVELLDEVEAGGAPADAWILVSRPEDYPRQAAELQRAVDTATLWGSGLQESALRGRLRAYLEVLAE